MYLDIHRELPTCARPLRYHGTAEHGMTDVPGGAIDARPPASRFSAAAVLRPALTVGAACGEWDTIKALKA